MDDRVAVMRECGEYQCPSWCSRAVDEGEYQAHFSEWQLVLSNPAVHQDIHVYAQAFRSWDAEDGSAGSVELSIRGQHAVPGTLSSRDPEPGEVAQMCLDSPDLETLFGGVQDVQALADMTDHRCTWVWAWDGAEDEYNALEAEEE